MSGLKAPSAPSRNQGYDLLRIISICAVVAIHTFGPTGANPEIAGTFSSFGARILSSGAVWSVPVFVMLSGALNLTPRAHRDGPAAFYRKRFRRIVPALIAWNLIYLVLTRMLLLHEPISGRQAVTALIETSVYPQLYFLWLIAGLYVIAPVLAAFLAGGGRRRVVILAVVVVAATQLYFISLGVLELAHSPEPLHWQALMFWIPFVGYFVAGYALSLVVVRTHWAVVAMVGIVVLGAAAILEAAYAARLPVLVALSSPDYQGTLTLLLAICVFVAGTVLLGRMPLTERLQRVVLTLSEASFGVFLVHLLVLLIPYALLVGFATHRSFAQALVAYLFILVVSFAISIGARRVPGLRLIF